MALEKISQIKGTAVHVPGDDIDTDRIIPARFMKCVTFDGLGEYAFFDVRFDGDGNPTPHVLNDPARKQASILVTGVNFGCGSSREHAPQALYRYGFRAVIAGSFAEIFFGNCTTLGIPCMTLSQEDLTALQNMVDGEPSLEVVIDVAALEVTAGEKSFQATMPSSARDGLLEGKWDPIGELLEGADQVAAKAATLPYFASRQEIADAGTSR